MRDVSLRNPLEASLAAYFVNMNAQDNGDHEVHKAGCIYMPSTANRLYLGVFTSCREAVREAKKTYPQSNGCVRCSEECHTQ